MEKTKVLDEGAVIRCAHCGGEGARDRTGEPGDVGEPICDRCVGSNIAHGHEPKRCAKCGVTLGVPELPPDEPERCQACADGGFVVTNVDTDGVMHVTLPTALAAHQQVAIATKDRPVVVHAASVPSVALPHDAKPGEVFLVMLDTDGEPVCVRSTLDSEVLRSATMSTERLLADLLSGADRNLDMLKADAGGDVSFNDVRAMVHSLCRNFAQGLQGRVLP